VLDVWRSWVKKVGAKHEEDVKILNECVVKKDTPEETMFNAFKRVEKKVFAH
jgi:hypothetical protein